MLSNSKSLVKDSYSIYEKFIFILYMSYFILKPFYFWQSGLPQISDFLIVSLIFILSIKDGFKIRFNIKLKTFLLIGLIFSVYVVFLNLLWAFILSTTDRFIFSSTFYIYNFFVVVLIVGLFSKYKEKIVELTYKSVLISVYLQVLLYIINGGFSGERMTGSFNNPNQLGYYALLVVGILIFCSTRIKVKTTWFILGLMSAMILALSSLSKAAILSVAGLIIIFLISRSRNKKLKRNLIILSISILFLVLYLNETTNVLQENQLIQSVQNRINTIGNDSDDSLAGRGYYRISEYPQYWAFGAGEGGYSRFRLENIELHSTLGNIQVSYGLVGTLLFVGFILLALKNNKYHSWYIIFFILVFGLTHNGIRNSMFWILVSLIACAHSIKENKFFEGK